MVCWFSWIFFFFSYSAEDWTQGFGHPRQAFHLAIPLGQFFLDFLYSKLHHEVSHVSFPILVLTSGSYFTPLASTSSMMLDRVFSKGLLISFLLDFSSLSKTTLNPKTQSHRFLLSWSYYIQIKVLRSHTSHTIVPVTL